MHALLDNYFKFVKKVVPSGYQGSVVGLEIGGGACKAVELKRKADGFEVLRWQAQTVDAPEEKGALEKLATSWGLSSNQHQVITAVSGKGTLIRYIDMPRMPLAELKRAFLIEADKYFPFPKDTVYIDCCILDPRSADKRMSVLIAAVKKDVLDAKHKLFKSIGIDVAAVTLNSIAVANAFMTFLPSRGTGKASGTEGQATAIIDIGEGVTNLMIMSGNIPRFNRDIFTGTQDAYKRVMNVTGVSPAEAHGIVASPGDRREAVVQGIAAFMDGLVSEVRISFDYFNTEKNLQIGQILVIGEGAILPGVETIFQERFDMPIVSWNPFEGVGLSADVVKSELYVQSPRLVTTLGLALNEYD
jgi:type IV pilus assembly protein PilM